MSSNVKLGNNIYNGVSTVKLPLAAGSGYATFSQENLQEKTAVENGEVTPDTGYTGLSKVNVNVSGSGGISAASGTIPALESNAAYLKINNLDFTPKAFRIVANGTIEQNCTGGGFYVRGTRCGFRTGTNNTQLGAMSVVVGSEDLTTQDDSYVPTGQCEIAILEHGFAVAQYSSSFPFKAGMAFDWYAVG